MAEIFKSKYTAEQIEEIFDHVNDKNPQIDKNTEDINKLKEWIENNNIISIEWPEELPTENISTKTIYMIKDTESTVENNIYIEYVYNENTGWEIIGKINTSINLSNYTDQEITEIINRIWGE